jgi:hypothetical protein
LEKAAANGKDVLECAAVDADLQNAAVKRVLKTVIVAEIESGIFKRIDRHRRRVEMLVADHSRIINPRGIWRRVGGRAGIPGIRRLPEYPIGVNHVARCPPRRQGWRSYIVEVLK